MKKIYLAGPFSHPDHDVMEFRSIELARVAGLLISKGHLVYSPITHSKPIADLYPNFPKTFEFWRPLDESMIMDWANAVWVLNIPGWETSIGVQHEVELAINIGLEVKLLTIKNHVIPHIAALESIKMKKIIKLEVGDLYEVVK